MKIHLSTILIFLSLKFCFGQQNLSFFSLTENSQANTLNPAIQSPCKIYIGLPLLSSIHFNFGNNLFTYQELIEYPGQYIEAKDLNISNNNSIDGEFYLNDFSFGLRWKQHYFNFNISEKFDFLFSVPGDFIEFAIEGNSGFVGKAADFGLRPVADYRREYALGYSFEKEKNLFLGVKAKLLFGRNNLKTRLSELGMKINPNDWSWQMNADYKIYSSAPFTPGYDANGRLNGASFDGFDPMDYIFSMSNQGFAFDFGYHQVLDKHTFSASILDLGIIRYSKNIHRYELKGAYNFYGLNGNAQGNENPMEAMFLEMINQFDVEITNKSYLFFLPTRIYYSYQYNIYRKINLGGVSSMKIYKYKLLPSLSALASIRFSNYGKLAFTFSYINKSLKNLGTAVTIGKTAQFYIATDNLLAVYNPYDTRLINFRMGLNLNFGCASKGDELKRPGCGWLDDCYRRNLRYQKLEKKYKKKIKK